MDGRLAIMQDAHCSALTIGESPIFRLNRFANPDVSPLGYKSLLRKSGYHWSTIIIRGRPTYRTASLAGVQTQQGPKKKLTKTITSFVPVRYLESWTMGAPDATGW
ncbi:hypothetical protein E4U57_008207 [Claviceps arundinis]|uniref:Uncharacterized protein n=1 Tax=Claviceps arundinis TaxID=1623583 RepID=A0A9P7MW55_9HYPO|nr:hypothetical protein E4U57_008207 [Claviceps arundinis]KAG5972052.1 hypothetical protein E4U56_006416 [Claviceps arundinis]